MQRPALAAKARKRCAGVTPPRSSNSENLQWQAENEIWRAARRKINIKGMAAAGVAKEARKHGGSENQRSSMAAEIGICGAAKTRRDVARIEQHICGKAKRRKAERRRKGAAEKGLKTNVGGGVIA